MNSRLLNAFLLLSIISIASCSEATINALEQIKNKEFAQDTIGQQIVDTVQLQLATGGKVDTIIRLIQGISSDLTRQQQAHDVRRAQRNAAWKSQIAHYNSVIAALSAKIHRLNRAILSTQSLIRSLTRSIRVTRQQIRLVSQKKAALMAARKVDQEATAKRVKRQSEMLKAVNYIIASLQSALKNGKFVQLAEIKEQLAKLAKENPIEALVELTMTFNPKSVSFAISKLNEIRSALQASIKDEGAQEVKAQREYKALLNEINSFLSSAQASLARLRARRARARIHLHNLRKARSEARALRKANRGLRNAAIAARAAYNAKYHRDTKERNSEQGVLARVIQILKDQAGTINRAEADKFTKK